MELTEIIQNFGIGAAMVVVFSVFLNKVTDHFIKTIQSKETAQTEMARSFSETVNDHMAKHTESIDRLNSALNENTSALRACYRFGDKRVEA